MSVDPKPNPDDKPESNPSDKPPKDDKPEPPPASTIKSSPAGPPQVGVRVEVDPKAVRELQQKLAEVEAREKAARAKIDALEDEKLQVTEKYDDLDAQLKAIAMQKFAEKKKVWLDTAKEKGLEEEKLKEIGDMLQTPDDMKRSEYYLNLLLEGITKGAQPPPPPPQPAESAGQATIKPTTGIKSKTGLKLEFDNPQQLANYLYDVSAGRELVDGKPPTHEQREEANNMKRKLWEKMIMSDTSRPITVSECPKCYSMIPTKDPYEPCPKCGWNQTDPRRRRVVREAQPIKLVKE